MDSVSVKICWLNQERKQQNRLPEYQTAGSAGMDICAAIEGEIILQPQDIVIIPTGFSLEIPNGYEAQIRPRSGIATKYGITLINSPGTIDCDYRGEIKIPLINHGKEPFTVRNGDRIAQMLIAPVSRTVLVEVESLSSTKRGHSGFGHTGR